MKEKIKQLCDNKNRNLHNKSIESNSFILIVDKVSFVIVFSFMKVFYSWYMDVCITELMTINRLKISVGFGIFNYITNFRLTERKKEDIGFIETRQERVFILLFAFLCNTKNLTTRNSKQSNDVCITHE